MCAELRKGQEEEERLDPSVKQGIRFALHYNTYVR